MNESIITEVTDSIGTVTFNRPDRLNAIDLPTLEDLIDALKSMKEDDEVRCVVLAGRGKAFCAGADISEMVPRDSAEWEQIVKRYLDPIRLISGMDRPVVARLHGNAIGGGFGIALACDFRVASEEIQMGAPFVKLGLAGCDMSVGYYLPRLIGLGQATDLMMTGRLVDAREAKRMGLINRVVAHDSLDSAVDELTTSLAEGAPRALAFTKRAIRRSLDRTIDAEFDYEVFAQTQCLQSDDHRKGLAAFREGCEPNFSESPHRNIESAREREHREKTNKNKGDKKGEEG